MNDFGNTFLLELLHKHTEYINRGSHLRAAGWTVVASGVATAEAEEWLSTNCKGLYEHIQHNWYFEFESDATWFALQWSDAKEPESDLMQVLRQYVSLTNIV